MTYVYLVNVCLHIHLVNMKQGKHVEQIEKYLDAFVTMTVQLPVMVTSNIVLFARKQSVHSAVITQLVNKISVRSLV